MEFCIFAHLNCPIIKQPITERSATSYEENEIKNYFFFNLENLERLVTWMLSDVGRFRDGTFCYGTFRAWDISCFGTF
jgi:hypothetical protein